MRQLRIPIGFCVAGLYLLLARPTTASLAVGMPIALVGLAFRAWAAGHIVKNDRLTVSGPYAHTRNPLYFGSFLIALGFALAASYWLVIPLLAFFGLVYAPTIRSERLDIRARFGVEYDEFERNVPAFFPRPLPWRPKASGATERFTFARYARHKEWQAALGFALAFVWLLLRASGTS